MIGLTNAATVSRRRVVHFVSRIVVAGAVAGLMAGCASTDKAPAAASIGAVPAGSARLQLTRVSGVLYMGAQASVRINGQEVANLWRDSSETVHIAPGANVITVGAFLHPGVWTINLNAKPGATYTIEISPRGESYAPAVLGGLAGTMIDAAVNENAGAFKARLVQ